MRFLRQTTTAFAPFLLVLVATVQLHAQGYYQTGDILEEFTLTERGTGKTVHLSDFEGKIVFLDWFAYWCPFCQAAAPSIESGIVQHYVNGNRNGVPVMYVAVNLQGGAETQTQSYIDAYHIPYVTEDFNRDAANKFAPQVQPIFAIVNGVANSPSHEQWELVYSHVGYGNNTQPISEMQSAIDSVKAGVEPTNPPEITTEPNDMRIGTGDTLSLSVIATGDQPLSYQWQRDGENIEDATEATLTIASATLDDADSYTVIVTNGAGSDTSRTADVTIVTSFADYLAASGAPAEERGLDDDPDRDGIANAFEYLAQTNPMDASSALPPSESVIRSNQGIPYLALAYPDNTDATIGIALASEFAGSPSLANAQPGTPIESESPNWSMVRSPTSLSANSPTFARLVATAQ